MNKGNSRHRKSGFGHSSRPQGGFRRGGDSRPGRQSRGGGHKGQRIDPARFINKAVVSISEPKFVPEHAFADFKVDARLKANIVKKGYVTPTPIQDKAIPHILKGADVVGIANTGTGKTAAFLIPLIDKVLKDTKESVLIVVPTRELALQIEEELRGFAKGLGLFGTTCVGGASIGRQISDLRHHNNFVIGTPGRLKDLMQRGHLKLERTNSIVLDEADRMLDMGFINDMRFMMSRLPKVRHTLFFSATISKEIEALIKDFLHNPVSISVKVKETPTSVDQDVVAVRGKDKLDILHDLLNQDGFDKVLVFGRTKHGVEKLAQKLVERGFKAESIHGNKTQGRRQRALDLFKRDHVQVLVATDVAARGLDIAGVSHVINYDLPATYEDYVHRIGRTGR
ncbi:DEAD/DEAH box helicase, partial [Candidatus Parcubacteria bacterium]|nr:DEAD/DEAH box helicase [Candidatus Parcubacteria bacterium]